MMQEGGLDCVTGLGKYQGRLIILLDINRVLAARDSESETTDSGKSGTISKATNSTEHSPELGTVKKSVSAGK